MPYIDPDISSYSLDEFILTYSSLPMHYVLHNRQTKYIGGLYTDFKKKFDGRKEVGSIWIRNDTVDSIRYTMNNAIEILAYYPSLIVGLHERFLETLCCLEVVFGHVRSFTWKEDVHAHDFQAAYNATKENRIIDKYKKGARAAVYESWRQRNEADIELYNITKQLFDTQLVEALRMLKELKASGKKPHAPHCEAILLQ